MELMDYLATAKDDRGSDNLTVERLEREIIGLGENDVLIHLIWML